MFQQPRHIIGPQEVHVWHLLVNQLDDQASLQRIHELLSPSEQARLNCFRKAPDRTLFLLSRGLLRTVLASYLGCTCEEVCFGSNEFGKPVLHPRDTPTLHFNLTHSRGAAALAISSGREVGIDIEERHRPIEYLLLAERYFAAAEAAHLRTLAEPQLAQAFFAIWTLKEAFVKGIGRGLSFPLDAFCFDLDRNRLVRFRPLVDFVSPNWHFHQFELGERHCGAVAVCNPAQADVQIEMREWHSSFVG